MGFDDDKAAILDVLRAETEAFLLRDLEALASHWVHAPYARRMTSVANLGSQVFEGWDAIKENYRLLMVQFPDKHAIERMHWERMNVVISGDVAWVTYDQVGKLADDKFEMGGLIHELKILQRIDGRWKIACLSNMQRSIDHEACPLIEVDSDRSVLWMNGPAHEQLTGEAMLLISGNKLRSRDRKFDGDLQEAITWAAGRVGAHWTVEPLGRPARAVILGENENAAPQFCWVLLEDGKILVSFNNRRQLSQRIAMAQAIYGLSTVQAQVAELIAEGHDPSFAAEKLGIGITTVRTHLKRIFDRTGARSQSALVGKLLSAETPTAR
jgi:DNA-binding CsgD family transcriptional regulator